MIGESRSSAGGSDGGCAYPPASVEHERKLPRLAVRELREEEEDGRRFYFMADGRAVCGRRKKLRNRHIEDEACLAPPTALGPCRVHGGCSTGGPWKANGRYSRVLKRWSRGFHRALADQELLDVRRELALMDVQIERLVVRAESGDVPTWREGLRAAHEELDGAIRDLRHADVGPALRRLGELIAKGAKADQVRRDLMTELERRSRCANKVAEIELKREEKVTQTELSALLGTWIGILQRNVSSDDLRKVVPLLRGSLPSPMIEARATVRDEEPVVAE